MSLRDMPKVPFGCTSGYTKRKRVWVDDHRERPRCACGRPSWRGGFCSLACEVGEIIQEGDAQPVEHASSPGEEADRRYHGDSAPDDT